MTRTDGDIAQRIATLDAELRTIGEPGRAERERRYLKSELEHYGCAVPDVRHVARSVAFSDRRAVLELAEALWREPVHERRLLAIMLLVRAESTLVPDDAALVEQLLRQCGTWALVDELAIRCAGPLLDRHPDADSIIDRWARDPDMWLRRAALLVHLLALRSGSGDWDRFCRHADAMVDDPERWIRKAIGWVLRDTGRRRPELVAEWVLPRRDRLSSVTRREVAKVVPGL